MAIKASRKVVDKLRVKHAVSMNEVHECFANGAGIFLTDSREEHRTDPPTQWFMAPTHRGRMLKVCFVRVGSDIFIKTAFEPDRPVHLQIYVETAGLPARWPEEE